MSKGLSLITIPAPEHSPRARGINSTSPLLGEQIKVRVNRADYRLLTEEAQERDLSLAEFVRWSAVFTAKALRKQREEDEHGKDDRSGK